jgi:hypothetical protein
MSKQKDNKKAQTKPELYTLLGAVRLLTIKNDGGYSESIVIPNTNVETIKKGINQIHTSDYVDSNCVDFKYSDGFGTYFDQVMWQDVTIDVTELRVLS